MKKRRIVLASLLKPVNETRMFEKMGNTLATAGYDVFIIGMKAPAAPAEDTSIHSLPHGPFKRTSLRRLTEPFRAFASIRKVKPDLLIVNTHELLIVGILNRILFGTPLIYDVQENYYRNIRFSEAFPVYVRGTIAFYVRCKEYLTSPFVRWFFLAEKGYENEMSFFKKRYTILENKCQALPGFERKPDPSYITLLFSGTLATSTGIFDAITLARKLHALDARIRLTIIGYCALPDVLQKIRSEIKDLPYINLIGGDQLVPHSKIMSAIATANVGLICYPHSPHTQNSIPTKLYEYLTCQLPIILQQHKPWVDICAPYAAAIPIDFSSFHEHDVLSQLTSRDFYTSPPENTTWTSEEPKLLQAVSACFAP